MTEQQEVQGELIEWKPRVMRWIPVDVANMPLGLEIWINLDHIASFVFVPPQPGELFRTLQVTTSFGGNMVTTDGATIMKFRELMGL